MKNRGKVLVLFDLGEPPPEDHDYRTDFKTDAWETEGNVVRALTSLGYEVITIGLYDNLTPLIEALKKAPPIAVFNLAESFSNERKNEPHVAAFLELQKIPYTGAKPAALTLCKNKGLTKKILTYHHIRVPRFVVSHRRQPLRTLRKFRYPAFVKPLGQEASVGISKDSFADDEKSCLERVRFVHENLAGDAIIEEYAEGRELYVSLFGGHRPTVFPPRELFFAKMPDDEPKFATFQAKWNPKYRKRWGIKTGPAKDLDKAFLRRLHRVCRRAYRVLEISGYARIDLRLTSKNEIVILEVNPNPTLAKSEDFAQSAAASGLGYEKLLERILRLAVRR